MLRKCLMVTVCAAILVPTAFAQNGSKPLTNEDILQMMSSGLPENVVVGAISANDANFDVSPNGLLALKKAGVSDRIVMAMLSAGREKRNAARAAIPVASVPVAPPYNTAPRMGAMGVPIMNSPGSQAPAQFPKVFLLVGDQKFSVQPSSTEIAQSRGKGSSAAAGTLKGFGKGMMMAGNMAGAPIPHGGSGRAGMPGVAYTWALPGRNSSFVIPVHSPNFEIEFSDLAGIDPDNYEPVIVKLIQTKDNWRLVEKSKDKFDKHGNDTRSTKVEDKTPLKITLLSRGHVQVTPTADLAPGEYGLVLHPKKNQKEFAGVPSTNIEALFYCVWDFSVQEERTPAVASKQPK